MNRDNYDTCWKILELRLSSTPLIKRRILVLTGLRQGCVLASHVDKLMVRILAGVRVSVFASSPTEAPCGSTCPHHQTDRSLRIDVR